MEQVKVLIVDDDEDVLALIQHELSKAGIKTDGVASADEGLAKMDKQLYPVVVTDIHMPGMNGVQMLTELKRRNPLVQVIMLTSDSSMERVIDCLDRGAIDFFAKNEGLYQIVEAVTHSLGRASRWANWIGTSSTPLKTSQSGSTR